MKREKNNTKIRANKQDAIFIRKVIRSYRKMGLILLFSGFGLMFLTVFILMYLLIAKVENVWMYYALLLAILFLGSKIAQHGLSLIQLSKIIVNPGGGTYTAYSILKCPKCGFMKTREFARGDYIGKVVEDTCEICGSKMVVSRIYAKPERKIESTGIPILPIAQQSRSLKAFILDLFSPFKIAFRTNITRRPIKKDDLS